MNKIVDDDVMVFDFALLVVVNVADYIYENRVFVVKPSFLFAFTYNCLL